MSSKLTKINVEDQILQLRKEGLQTVTQINAMNAHGKVLGMDTFSWINPQIDALASALTSFPFKVIWIGDYQQIENCLRLFPDSLKSIDTVIIQDKAEMNLDPKSFVKISNIICIEQTEEALNLLRTVKKEKSIFLYTTGGKMANENKVHFNQFISLFK